MKKLFSAPVYLRAVAVLLMSGILFAACRKFDFLNPKLKHFVQVNLVDNNGAYNASHTDSTLINGWGIAFSPNGIAWVNSQGGHVSAIYDKEGNTVRPAVAVPSPGGATGGNPTGIVFNGSTAFALSKGGAARFIFVGADGILSGWNGEFGGQAELIKDNSASSAYTGLATAKVGEVPYLYAADFRGGKIEVWDSTFTAAPMEFKDPEIPQGYAPFNIEHVGERLYVLYAKVGADGRDEKGEGLGYVSIFKTDGSFVKRFASHGALNAPWGIAAAPASFFTEEEWTDTEKNKQGKILVGNFGDGYINVYSEDGVFIGPIKSAGRPMKIDGLWAITFAPSTATAVDPNRLYFAAGPDDATAGLFGYIIKK